MIDRLHPEPLCSGDITSPSPLLWAHARIPLPLASLSCIRLIGSVLAAHVIHGWSTGPSRFCSAFLLLRCCVPYAGGLPSALDQFFLGNNDLRPSPRARLSSAMVPQTVSRGSPISTRQTFSNIAALQLARPPDRSAPLPQHLEDFYARACDRFVTSSTVEYATR